MPKKPHTVEVEWDDTWSEGARVDSSSDYYVRPYPVYEVGFLKSTKGGRVVVCLEWSPGIGDGEEPCFKRCVSIPRRVVKKITRLKE